MSKDIGFCSITEDICRKEGECETCSLKHIHENIEHYAKLHEENRLIELPCKVGDAVWQIEISEEGYDFYKFTVTGVNITEKGIELGNFYHGFWFKIEDFGKTVFLTSEELQAKLAEAMEDGEKISERIMENEFYEVSEDFMTGTYTVRVGNPVLTCKGTGVKALKGTEEW